MLNRGRPSPGFFERFYWLIWIICLRPCLVIGFEPSQELCWICGVFEIPSVDIEHGIRDFHPISGTYFYRNSYRYNNSILPDYLLTTFDDEILADPFFQKLYPKPSLINAGDLELAYHIKNFLVDDSSCTSVDNCDSVLSILLLSQYNSRFDSIAKILPDFVVDFIEKIASLRDLSLTIRLHPKTAEDYYAQVTSITRLQQQLPFLNNLFFEHSTNSSLISSIASSHIVMTDDSSAYKTSLLLEKTTICWSSSLQPNLIESSSRKFFFKLNSSNIQDLSSFINESRLCNSFDVSRSEAIFKADHAYNYLLSLCLP